MDNEIYNCECGKTVKKNNMKYHEISRRHQAFKMGEELKPIVKHKNISKEQKGINRELRIKEQIKKMISVSDVPIFINGIINLNE